MKKSSILLVLVLVLLVSSFGTVLAQDAIKVALVMPSTKDDYAFSQSMYESLMALQAELGEDKIEVLPPSEGYGDAAKAEEMIRGYADDGADIVIAHGSQYGTKIQAVAPDYPETVFAWGNGADTYGLENVYAYNAKAEQGGYVMGFIAAMTTESGIVGLCGPVDSGDAQTYADGFAAGAADAGIAAENIRETFTGSFGDVSLMNAAAKTHLDEGADVLTGSSQAIPGAVSAVKDANATWLGVQYDTTGLAPEVILANIVYDWKPMLEGIISDRENGILGGSAVELTFENGGLTLKWNEENFNVPQEAKDIAQEKIDGIIAGDIVPLQ